jgi:hypothetical protein
MATKTITSSQTIDLKKEIMKIFSNYSSMSSIALTQIEYRLHYKGITYEASEMEDAINNLLHLGKICLIRIKCNPIHNIFDIMIGKNES